MSKRQIVLKILAIKRFSGSLDNRVVMDSSDPVSEGYPARRTRSGTCDARLYLVDSPCLRTLEAFFSIIESDTDGEVRLGMYRLRKRADLLTISGAIHRVHDFASSLPCAIGAPPPMKTVIFRAVS